MLADLSALLAPQELEDYDLRMSDTANRLPFNLRGFAPYSEWSSSKGVMLIVFGYEKPLREPVPFRKVAQLGSG
jgi:hypothetical protein